MSMNTVLAQTFLKVLETRNLYVAAERLHVTQSAVSMRISTLEELVGQRLFVRKKTGVEPTAAGLRLQPYAEMLVRVWEQAREELALPRDIARVLRVGIDPALWHGFTRAWALAMRGLAPEVGLFLHMSESQTLLAQVSQGLHHAVLMFEPQPRGGLTIKELFNDRLVLVSTEPREKVRWHPAYVYVEWGEDLRRMHSRIQPTEVTPPVTFTHGDWALDFILARGGSGFFPVRSVRGHVDAGRLHVVKRSSVMSRPAYLVYADAIEQTPGFMPLLEALERHAAEEARVCERWLAQHSTRARPSAAGAPSQGG